MLEGCAPRALHKSTEEQNSDNYSQQLALQSFETAATKMATKVCPNLGKRQSGRRSLP
jgi:hypothetical protein